MAALLVAVLAVLLLDGCSQRYTPGIRHAEDGSVHVRASVCPGDEVGLDGVSLEVQRWDDDATEYVTVWTDDDPAETATGEFVIDVDAAGLEPDQDYAVDVIGSGTPWFGHFRIDELPPDGSFDAGLDGTFPATPEGREALDDDACSAGDVDWGALAVVFGVAGVIALLFVGGLIGLIVWLTRRTAPPPPPPPPPGWY